MPTKLSLKLFLLLQYLSKHPEHLAFVQEVMLIRIAQQRLLHKNIFSGDSTCFHA